MFVDVCVGMLAFVKKFPIFIHVSLSLFPYVCVLTKGSLKDSKFTFCPKEQENKKNIFLNTMLY